ncbi:RNA polymerase-associated protein RapA [Lactobacillus helveticus]|uniref:DEAD/DEAH box helicase family protein n=1 Tax=Lactobacillus helveticus TaxID=1587 RepID=UPI00156297EB|nr:DEAD/DEAH box helicase family protein [Lactobacillus helveticus]NRO31611.1 RNA polymerase-associated protein RapA [Lactobacillus helveticus]NRO59276.1 RNA polymerase-associated protein RapA [Lactobacillus helveticus]
MTTSSFENKLFSKKVIDNRNVSMTDALKYLLSQEEFRILDVAVGYFYISGLLLLKDEFTNFMDNRNGHFRILMGNETNGATVNVLDNSNYNNYAELIQHSTEKDTSKVSDKEFLGKVADWINDGKIEVKIYTGDADYFHAKSYLFASSLNTGNGTAIVGSSNFSKAGLEGNTELNVLTQDGFFALHEWYNGLWLSKNEVTDFSPDLVEIAQVNGAKKTIQEYKPVKETYYDFANMFAKPYAKLDTKKEWVQSLFPHQRSGIISIKEKLDSFDTAVLSDGVGLGKTRTAAGVIRLYLESESVNRILIVADTKLKDQWHDELKAVGIKHYKYEYMSRQQLVGMSYDQLKDNNYTLMVIDEAHLGFKNNNTEAYKKVLFMKQNNPKLKGLLLTATPWNNEREDVINIGSLFLNINAIPNDRKYKQYFLLSPNKLTNKVVKHLATDDAAFKEFWSDIYLQRTRKTYGGKGTRFPHRNFPSVDIAYEPRKNEIFSNNFDIISDLKFPYQDPIKYIDDSKEELGAKQLKMLLLKRADSSWKAYANSLQNIVNKLDALYEIYLKPMSYLKGKTLLSHYKEFLGRSYNISDYENNLNLLTKDLEPYVPEDPSQQTVQSQLRKERYIENLRAQINSITVRKAKNAVEKMTADYSSDLSTLKMLISNLTQAYSKVDEKVDKIIQCIDKERSKGHKIILVSQFADTVEYYYDKLYSHYNSPKITYPMGMITGAATTDKKGYSAKINKSESTKKSVLEHFSPHSKRALNIIEDNLQIDLVVGTDTISTGQNLQDAVTLMNIDLPYNPMTLEQRIGRIDRPLAKDNPNDQIYIYTFPIYQSINSQLKMMKRLGNKMAGVLNDTEFDNVVLPQYEGYLKDIQAKKHDALKTMLDKTDEQLINHTDFSSEKHSEAYQQANKRMYDFKANQIKPFKNPLIPNYSFSNGRDDHSVVVVEIQYFDVNGSFLEKENILVNADNSSKIEITEAEKNLNKEIEHDVHNSNVLPQGKALTAVKEVKDRVLKVVKLQINQYNKQHEFFAENLHSTKNKTSSKAAVALRDSAMQDKEMVISKLKSVNVDPKRLIDITKYIETIDKDDELFSVVKEIANNPGVFWLKIKSYIKFFNPDTISEMETIGKDIQKVSTRKANLEKTKYKILTGNLVIK